MVPSTELQAVPAPMLRSAGGFREGEALAAGEEGAAAAAGDEVVDAVVEGSGSRTKNWRGLSRARKMLVCALPLALESGSSDRKSEGLEEPLHTRTNFP